MDQPKQPSILESMTNARDYWYGRAIALEHELETLKKPHAEPYKEGYMLLLADHTSLQARITELEARLAQTWQPLPDGTYHTNNAEIFRVVDGDMIVYAYGSATRIEFYQGQALCRLVESQQPYSHRNGETEPPMKEGWYAMQHPQAWNWQGSTFVFVERNMDGIDVYCAGQDDPIGYDQMDSRIRWYGPIVAPWEDSHE